MKTDQNLDRRAGLPFGKPFLVLSFSSSSSSGPSHACPEEQPLWGLTENRRVADEAAVDVNPLGADASLWFSGRRSLSG